MKPSKKTTTTPSRSTPFTLSWLAKSGSLFFVLAFIFFACQEDPTTIGFKPDRTKFRVAYTELELPSSVLMAGPTTTSNRGGDGLTPRLLVGSYTDETFGKIEAESYFQFRPNNLFTFIPVDATFESVTLNLSFDYYNYGSSAVNTYNFYLHELTDSLVTEGSYTNDKRADFKPEILATAMYTIDPAAMADRYARNIDSDGANNALDSLSFNFNLNGAFAQSLIGLIRSYNITLNTSTSKNDTTLVSDVSNFRKFRRKFKGLALRSDATDKIIGFNPSYSATGISRSRLLATYSYYDKINKKTAKATVEFTLYGDSGSGSISFTHLKADRAGTSLQNFDQLYKEFFPAADKRYVQSGNAIVTKFTLDKYFAFTDTIQNMLLNSAEIVIDPVEVPSPLRPPVQLGFKILNKKNRFLTSSDTLDNNYAGFVAVDKSQNFILADVGSSSSVSKNLNLIQAENTTPKYSATMTRYFQMLYDLKDKSKRMSSYALFPSNPDVNKSLDRLVFNKNNLKLRIYYTRPSTQKTE